MSVRRSIALAGVAVATLATTALAAAQPAAAATSNLECHSLGGQQAYCDLYKSGYGNWTNQEWDVNGATYAYGGNYLTIDCGGNVASVGASFQDVATGTWHSEFTKTTCY